ncbi:restriction endonuclease subunit S [Ottowia beijingensis]
MNEEKKLVPKLRFPEFRRAEGWEMTLLEKCLGYQQPTPYLVKDERYSPIFKTPVLTAGKTFILGYTNEEHGIFREGLPVIIFDDFTTATQFVDFPFKAKSSAMKILLAKDGANIKFMFETLRNVSFEVGAHERHWISTFAPMLVPIPKTAEQQKIADCLSSLDELIAAQARKVHALKTHKKGLMQQLFPREGETQPRLRFPEFRNAGEWKRQNLEDLSETISSGKDKSAQDGAFDLYGSTGVIGRTNSGSFSGIYILVARVGANAGLLTKATGEFGVTDNTLVITLKKRQVIGLDFIFFYLYQVGLNKMIFGSGQPLITGGQLKALTIQVPNAKEQQRIADCLNSLDTLITTATQELETFKTHKKGLMQQLFPPAQEVAA